ncbi:uncharacterized protein N7482_006513 [Penicillium canariense]|uniref:Uncharacterized protein n=1 Tax=Penicillium canariense TaxID=189055 RepID=A0A9W9HUQ2_9EURO|nr:uncharacterized protein N7482_006513 [Penicillium canariense]KAJ5159509.1 hypothetical protein N7482_006513 [Penicillium canariense]
MELDDAGYGCIMAVPVDQRLGSAAQWSVWIDHFRCAARTVGVWEYLDPALSDREIKTLPEPEKEPHPSLIFQNARDVADLTDEEYPIYHRLLTENDRREAKQKMLARQLSGFSEVITRSVVVEHRHLLGDEYSARQKLVKLAMAFALDEVTRTEELRRQWRQMIESRHPSDLSAIEVWLTGWMSLYGKALAAGVPDVCCQHTPEKFAIRDFLRAVQPHDDLFYSTWMDKIRLEDATFEEVISMYRTRRRITELFGKATPVENTVPTLFGYPAPPPTQDTAKGSEENQRTCVCGSTQHQWKQCYYLVKSIRPDRWRPRPNVERRVAKAIKQLSPSDQKKIAKITNDKGAAHIAMPNTKEL